MYIRALTSQYFRGLLLKFVLLIVAMHLVLVLWLGYTLNIWADESCSLATTGGNLVFAVHQAVNFEWQPPGYFVVLWFWRQFSDSIFWARALSAFCTAITVVLFFFLSRRLASEHAIWPYLATIVLAVHPYAIFAAVELRLYGMGLLLSVVQFDLFWRSYMEDQKRCRWWYLVVAVLSLYVNILLGLTLAAQNIVLWSSLRTKAACQHLISLVMAGVLYLPMFLLQVRSLIDKDIPIDDLGFVKALLFVVGTLTYNLIPIPRIDTTLILRSGLAITLVAAGSWTIRSYWRQIAMRHRAVWSYLLAVAFLLVLFLVATNLRTNPRYTYPIVIASLLAWGQLTDLIRNQSLVAIVWIASLVCCFGTLSQTYGPLCKTGDWIRVSRFLDLHEEADQPIVVFLSEVDTIMRHYYHGQNTIVPVPSAQRMDRFRYADFDIPSEQTVRDLLDPLLQHVDECWLVTCESAIENALHRYHQEYLYSYLEKEFDVVESTEFVDSKVSRLKRK